MSFLLVLSMRLISDFALRPRSKLQRDQDRDISELIALGVPNPRSAGEAQYDQRLFNQSKVRNNFQTHTSPATCKRVAFQLNLAF